MSGYSKQFLNSVVRAVLVMIVIQFGGRALAQEITLPPQLAPYWLESSVNTHMALSWVSRPELVGRTFVFLPVDDRPLPRYGRLTLFTFEENSIHERRPMVDVHHPIAKAENFAEDEIRFARPELRAAIQRGDTFFNFPDYLVVGKVMTFHGMMGNRLLWRPRVAIQVIDPETGVLELIETSTQSARQIGKLVEVKGDEAAKALAAIEAAEKAENEQRTAEIAATGPDPRPFVDFHDFLNGQFIEDVYYGRFGSGERSDKEQTHDNQRIKAMFLAYHTAYGLEYGESSGNMVEIADVLVTRNNNGVIIDQSEPMRRALVRKQYVDSFNYARSAEGGAALGVLFGGEKSDLLGLSALFFQPAMKEFLARYHQPSMSTVERLEQNLERFLLGREPLKMDGPASPAPYAALSDQYVVVEKPPVPGEGRGGRGGRARPGMPPLPGQPGRGAPAGSGGLPPRGGG